MANVTLQNAAHFDNPKGVVGEYSAGALTTNTFPNSAQSPNLFSNRNVLIGTDMFAGTKSNVKAAEGLYVPLKGGRRKAKKTRGKKRKGTRGKTSKKRSDAGHSGCHGCETGADHPGAHNHSPHHKTKKRKSSSSKKSSSPHALEGECRICDLGDEREGPYSGSTLCKECKVYAGERNMLSGGNKLSTMGPSGHSNEANGGTVGAGHPMATIYNPDSAGKTGPNADELHRGGKKRRRTKKRRGRKGKKQRRTKTKRRRHNKTKGRKRKGGAVYKCTKKSKKKGKRGKRGGCIHLMGRINKKGGSKQPFSNQPLSFSYGIDGSSSTLGGALSAPIPIKSQYACAKVARN